MQDIRDYKPKPKQVNPYNSAPDRDKIINIGAVLYSRLKRPCVYSWWRGGQCLYVGQSIVGCARVLSMLHHVIGQVCPVEAGDDFYVYWYDNITQVRLLAEEAHYIQLFAPRYNIQNNEKKVKPAKLYRMRKRVSAEAKLATVLQSEVPVGSLLEHASGDPDQYREDHIKRDPGQVTNYEVLKIVK